MLSHKSKFIFAVLLILVLGLNANAQIKRPHLLVGANIFYANPRAGFSNAYHFGIGGELCAGIGFSKTYLVASYGHSIFFADNKNMYENITAKPVKIGLKHYFLANKIFINGDVGVALVKDKTMDESLSRFTRGIGAGVHFLGLEAGLYYDGWKSLHTTGYSNSVLVKVGWDKVF